MIKLATQADANAIATIHVASWQKAYRGLIDDSVLDTLSIEKREQQWRDLINEGLKILLIEKDHQIVGFASICSSRDADTDPQKCGEISSIYMHPNFWHQALGKQLCSTALKELKKMGFSEAILWVLEENTQAHKFYETMGFTNTGLQKINTLSADMLGVNFNKQTTENTKVTLREIRYYKKLSNLS